MIIMAKTAGFCFGVKRAIKIALSADPTGGICSLGPLIHNPREVKRLEKLGICGVGSIDEIKGNSVIVRSHGVSPQVMTALRKKNLHIIDATCPFVEKAQKIALTLQQQTDQVIIVGDKNHPEVIGILGFLHDQAIVVNSLTAAKKVVFPENVGIMSQTTQSLQDFQEIVDYIKEVVPQVTVCNTICKATIERQEEVANLAKKVEAMVVIGGKNSANTRKLADIAKSAEIKVFIVEDVAELDMIKNEIDLSNGNVGVTAGASTPDWIIEEVMEKMKW